MTSTALQVAKFDVLSAANVVLYAQNLLKSLAADPIGELTTLHLWEVIYSVSKC